METFGATCVQCRCPTAVPEMAAEAIWPLILGTDQGGVFGRLRPTWGCPGLGHAAFSKSHASLGPCSFPPAPETFRSVCGKMAAVWSLSWSEGGIPPTVLGAMGLRWDCLA